MTAEELFGKHFNGLHYDDITPERIEKYAIEFAKYHVEKALKEAVNNMKDGYVTDQDEEDVLNCYPPEKIK